MKKRLKYIVIVFFLAFESFSAVAAEKFECSFEEQFKDDSSRGADVLLALENSKIVSLDVYSSFASGEEGGGYLCAVETSVADPDREIKWVIDGPKTTLELQDNFLKKKSFIEIQKNGDTYTIDLGRAPREACGFGADWPSKIVVEKGNKKCLVTF
jgi:hypothetical protein